MKLTVLSERGQTPRLAVVEVAASDVGRLRAHGQPHWVRGACARSSGAPAPPIFVATQPGSTALADTSGHRPATITNTCSTDTGKIAHKRPRRARRTQ